MKHLLFGCGVVGSLGARLDSFAELDVDVNLDVMMMTQAVSMANGFLNVTAGAEINKQCDAIWPNELSKKFRDTFVVGSGATACVFLGYDDTNTLVAIKVGKGMNGKSQNSAFASWKAECDAMQRMRMAGCEADDLNAHEVYLPTCTALGKHSKGGAYYVMHAAGVHGIKDLPTMGPNEQQRREVLSQLVSSINALHVVDLTHNDLHGTNIVLDDKFQLALIDFGSLKTLKRSWKKDYKRDGSATWRWAAVIANCPQGAQWPNPPTMNAGNQFIKCMQKFSGGEETFMAAITTVVKNAVHEKEDHGIMQLWKSKFIQSNQPALKKLYPWTGTGNCREWSKDAWAKYHFKIDFPGYVKCETLPTYENTKTKTKRGKTRVTVTKQCDIGQEFGSACWSKTPGKIWACGGCANGMVSADSDGGCLFSSHPNYAGAPDASN